MQLKSNSIFYIFCPANFATGGPEALHQLGYRLKALGHQVYMHYFYNKGEYPVHESYQKYNLPHTNDVLNRNENFIVTPETYLDPIFDYKYVNVKKIIWWLSVTNYIITLGYTKEEVRHKRFYAIKSFLNPKKYKTIPTIAALKRKNVLSLAHSYFSVDFLIRNKMVVIGKISDYMSEAFYQKVNALTIKEDVILYNPKKNGEYLDQVKALSSELNWKALIDMSPEEVALWMNKSKLYVDFGYHPGQERMPREAILMGCCVITGSRGSAGYYQDVPLPEGFKFDETIDLPKKVVSQIKITLDQFEDKIKHFENYRKTIIAERKNFDTAVEKVFGRVEKK